MFRTVIVDDEPLARDLLQSLVAEQGDICIVKQCQDGEEINSTFPCIHNPSSWYNPINEVSGSHGPRPATGSEAFRH